MKLYEDILKAISEQIRLKVAVMATRPVFNNERWTMNYEQSNFGIMEDWNKGLEISD